MDENEKFARDEFLRRGVTVGKLNPRHEVVNYHFAGGGECHVYVFEGHNYIHWHSGKTQWSEHLAIDAPEVRIRSMLINGEELPESETFPC